MGPNMRRLVATRAAQITADACPKDDVFGGMLEQMSNGGLGKNLTAAARWCDAAVVAVRSAAEPNDWKRSSDEEIAAELLRLIDERKARKEA